MTSDARVYAHKDNIIFDKILDYNKRKVSSDDAEDSNKKMKSDISSAPIVETSILTIVPKSVVRHDCFYSAQMMEQDRAIIERLKCIAHIPITE